MLGVALPGIAPLHPGVAQERDLPRGPAAPAPIPERAPAAPAAPAPPRTQPVVQHPVSPDRSFAPAGEEPSTLPASPPRRTRLPTGAIVLIAVAAILAVTAGIVAFVWEAPHPMTARVVLDDRGGEALALTCDDCANGTTVSVGKSEAKFDSHHADVHLDKPLDIGVNDVSVAVHRPGIGRDEVVKLAVNVGYRVRGDLSGLAEDPPKARVVVHAIAGTAVVVDGRPVALDASGQGEHVLDIGSELEGPADTLVPFERRLPYTVTPAGGQPEQGEVTLRFGIVPLRVDAPGDGIVIEGQTFVLSGRTLKDGRISVGGRPITVDTEGRFAQLMNVSSIGETTMVVRADQKDRAPRFVRIRVKRVASLKEEAAQFRQKATSDYATIAAADEKKGLEVALDGEVVEARIDGETTVLLLDVNRGCATAPCLARVIYGGRFETRRGAALGAFGHVHGAVDGPRTGVKIPEIAAEFLVPEAAKRR
jgi:hypothetical protein